MYRRTSLTAAQALSLSGTIHQPQANPLQRVVSLDTRTSARSTDLGVTTSQDTRLPELLLLLFVEKSATNYSNVIERVQGLRSRLLFAV